MKLNVQILPMPVDAVNPLLPQLHPGPTRYITLPIDPDARFEDVWKKLEQRFRSNYPEGNQGNWQFRKLKDEHGYDIDLRDLVSDIFDASSDKGPHIVQVERDVVGREVSMPPGSTLRPRGSATKINISARAAPQDHPTKRPRLDSFSFENSIRRLQPDEPIKSKETTEAQAFKMPTKAVEPLKTTLESHEPRLPASRNLEEKTLIRKVTPQVARSHGPGLAVPDSQASATRLLPRSNQTPAPGQHNVKPSPLPTKTNQAHPANIPDDPGWWTEDDDHALLASQLTGINLEWAAKYYIPNRPLPAVVRRAQNLYKKATAGLVFGRLSTDYTAVIDRLPLDKRPALRSKLSQVVADFAAHQNDVLVGSDGDELGTKDDTAALAIPASASVTVLVPQSSAMPAVRNNDYIISTGPDIVAQTPPKSTITKRPSLPPPTTSHPSIRRDKGKGPATAASPEPVGSRSVPPAKKSTFADTTPRISAVGPAKASSAKVKHRQSSLTVLKDIRRASSSNMTDDSKRATLGYTTAVSPRAAVLSTSIASRKGDTINTSSPRVSLTGSNTSASNIKSPRTVAQSSPKASANSAEHRNNTLANDYIVIDDDDDGTESDRGRDKDDEDEDEITQQLLQDIQRQSSAPSTVNEKNGTSQHDARPSRSRSSSAVRDLSARRPNGVTSVRSPVCSNAQQAPPSARAGSGRPKPVATRTPILSLDDESSEDPSDSEED